MAQLKITTDILLAALEGYEAEKNRIDDRIAEIKQMLGSVPSASARPAKPRKKRSAAVRRKMALAQRARYAKLRHESEPPQAVDAKPRKRKLSAEGRRAIIAATKKRWAAVRAAKQAEKPSAVQNAVRKPAARKAA